MAYYGLTPESALNHETLNLMCAANVDRPRRARLYVQNLYPLPVYCNTSKIMALQLDTLVETERGEDRQDAPADEDERLRDALLKGVYRDHLKHYLQTLRDD